MLIRYHHMSCSQQVRQFTSAGPLRCRTLVGWVGTLQTSTDHCRLTSPATTPPSLFFRSFLYDHRPDISPPYRRRKAVSCLGKAPNSSQLTPASSFSPSFARPWPAGVTTITDVLLAELTTSLRTRQHAPNGHRRTPGHSRIRLIARRKRRYIAS
ncbi:uncharacterized protein K489DRAFT_28731 [Dissoconium aciculare CBS 342.82]|uniref:Uncharacterized protein n=1 Tax=Dissoconium aciculare CBS 342.82 TaxID=1314786 RepID=A0A6J3MIT4_9PEZI|nr:uncharacterized protein K489DRAFT_28731 [Dissoconium aciculare CBS 342.82]KAF1827815.1 hypothetical protein K489DRAFT_28731 [Dissoconium aciculare CBS 342.82]